MWSNYKVMSSLNTPISPAQIAFRILKDSHANYPDYFNILDKLRVKYPYLHPNFKNKNAANDEIVKKYALIQYDLLFGKQYLNSFD